MEKNIEESHVEFLAAKSCCGLAAQSGYRNSDLFFAA